MRTKYNKTIGFNQIIKRTLTNKINISFDINTIHKAYEEGSATPTQVIAASHSKIMADKTSWIIQIPMNHVIADVENLDNVLKNHKKEGKSFSDLLLEYPLFGIPFGVKDNIDVAGFPTTAGCPSYSRTPWITAHVVKQLTEKGAILMGKQNMDQFAAGLAGVRSPYGIPENPFNPEYCPGGSCSGSGVAVSTHQVSFSIGTDPQDQVEFQQASTTLWDLNPLMAAFLLMGSFLLVEHLIVSPFWVSLVTMFGKFSTVAMIMILKMNVADLFALLHFTAQIVP